MNIHRRKKKKLSEIFKKDIKTCIEHGKMQGKKLKQIKKNLIGIQIMEIINFIKLENKIKEILNKDY